MIFFNFLNCASCQTYFKDSSSYVLALLWENRTIDLSPPNCFASLQVAKPIFCLSASTVLLYVSLGRPLLLLPSKAHVPWVLLVAHRQYMPYPAPPIVQVLALCRSSSLVTLIGQYSFNTLCTCQGMYPVSPRPSWSFSKSCVCRVALL